MGNRRWSAEEDAVLRLCADRNQTEAIAARLGRTVRSVYLRRHCLGLGKSQRIITPRDLRSLRRAALRGSCNVCLSRELTVGRNRIRALRRRLGLPPSPRGHGATCLRCRGVVRANMVRQCAQWGVQNMGELRSEVFRRRARGAGWPEFLRPREVQILELLFRHGPHTRREIAERTGLSGHPDYLAHLVRLGLVSALRGGCRGKGMGRGRVATVYIMPLWVAPSNLDNGQ